MITKTCFKCWEELPLDAYYKHPRMADGYLNKCKECTKTDTKKNCKKNKEYYRAYDKERDVLPHRVELRAKYAATEKGKERGAAAKRSWINRNPEARKAHKEVQKALLRKELFKKPCEVCGEVKVHAHHDDYSKPLEVVWLCPAHHKKLHDDGGS